MPYGPPNSSGSSSAGGSTTQIQFNSAGAFGGSANLVWDNTNAILRIGTDATGRFNASTNSGGAVLWAGTSAFSFTDFTLYASQAAGGLTQLNSATSVQLTSGGVAVFTGSQNGVGLGNHAEVDANTTVQISSNASTSAALRTVLSAAQTADAYQVMANDKATKLFSITANGTPVIPTATPGSAAATGTQGMVAWDASFIYICTATNTWKRVAIATW